MFYWIFLVLCVYALDPNYVFRQLTGPGSGVPPLAMLHTGPIANGVAYTDGERTHVYVDAERLRNAPHTTWNVIRHEIAHTKGAQHGDGSVEMKYSVTADPGGFIVDDNFFL
jgi:hypothetical protein